MEEHKLKVSDLVDFKESDYKLALSTIKSLRELSLEYSQYKDTSDPARLDTLKREFIGHMGTLTSVYSTVKAFKGSNHTYLEDARKQFKGEAYDILRKEGVGATEANTTVYASPYYVERKDIMEELKKFFIRVDEMHDYFRSVLQYMQQTVSIISKEYEYNRYSKN